MRVFPPVPRRCLFRQLQGFGIGRENHRMMLERYAQTKCLLVSYDSEPVGLF
jgi:aldehyde dehydrogenase